MLFLNLKTLWAFADIAGAFYHDPLSTLCQLVASLPHDTVGGTVPVSVNCCML